MGKVNPDARIEKLKEDAKERALKIIKEGM
jgi:hypothetical protein